LVSIPPATVAEALSNPKTMAAARAAIAGARVLEILPDYWLRVGGSRAKLISRKLKARLANALTSGPKQLILAFARPFAPPSPA
jgi:hypothetical protein